MIPPRSHFQAGYNFLGLPDELADPQRAQVWILPVPYEATTTYGAGTRNGPTAIIMASRQVELYDYRRGCEPASELGFATLPPLEIHSGSPTAMISRIEEVVLHIFGGDPQPRFLVALGGEHSISAGIASAAARIFDPHEIVAVQIDAHADLRDEFEGSPYNHACAARRILNCLPLMQIGIRNISEEEDRFRSTAHRLITIFADEWTEAAHERLAEFVRNKLVYLTIDLDGLDPSIMPAVGTPEPGGLSWQQIQEVIRIIAQNARGVPIMDVVELAPIPGLIAPDFLAAKLIYWAASDFLLREEKKAAL